MRIQIPTPPQAVTLGKLLTLAGCLHTQKYAGRKVGSLHGRLLGGGGGDTNRLLRAGCGYGESLEPDRDSMAR